jgi:hypothetical protein
MKLGMAIRGSSHVEARIWTFEHLHCISILSMSYYVLYCKVIELCCFELCLNSQGSIY